MLLQVTKKENEKSMPKEMPQVIVDAERNRRTLWETGESAYVNWRWGQLQINAMCAENSIEASTQ